ncbi:hypothetical protein BTHER_07616 [Brochothrix thermosphacta DSM 20171 = FSL F6-1036]|nr:hypothetical protein BTHER_07616 [Brochothrix thermosphacta DSM 20171 = FSL F6-1036]
MVTLTKLNYYSKATHNVWLFFVAIIVVNLFAYEDSMGRSESEYHSFVIIVVNLFAYEDSMGADIVANT